MLHPDPDTVPERTCLRNGADLPGQIEHVQGHGVAGQQPVLEVGELGGLECQVPAGGRETRRCQRPVIVPLTRRRAATPVPSSAR